MKSLAKLKDEARKHEAREEWEQVSEQLIQSRISSSKARSFTRFWFSGSTEESPDKQGRVHIPETLRTYARLDREVAVLGVGQRIQHHPVEDAEDRCVRADAQRERQHRARQDHGAPAREPDRETEVGERCRHRIPA